MSRNKLTMVAAGLASWLVASAALADDAVAVRRIHVRYSSTELHSSAGIDRLYVRLRKAADQACEYAMIPDKVDADCAARALDNGVADVGNPELTARHARTVMASRKLAAG